MADDDLFGIGFGGVGGDFSDDLPDDSIDGPDDAMDQMYQEFILEQARAPHGKVSSQSGLTRRSQSSDEKGESSMAAAMQKVSTEAGGVTTTFAGWRNTPVSYTTSSHQFNPTCGDDIVVQLCVDTHPGVFGSLGRFAGGSDNSRQQGRSTPEPVIASMCWSGHGCAICQASLSVLHDMVTGLPAGRFAALYGEFHELMDSRGRGIDDPEKQKDLGDALAFQGASRFPMRIKCALLGWEAVRDCLATLENESERENHGREDRTTAV